MTEKKIRMNLAAWSYTDFVEFMIAFRTGDTDKSFNLATQLIAQWDYDVSLSLPEPIMELGVIESARVIKTVVDAIGAYVEDAPIEGVTVDFSTWNTRKFLEFDNARKIGNTRVAEKLVHDIAKKEGVSPEGTLGFTDGASMFKAVTESYKRIISGKNS